MMRKVEMRGKLRSGRAGWLIVAVVLLLGMASVSLVGQAQTQAQAAQTSQAAQGVVGTWQGTLPVGKGMRIVVKIRKGDVGGWQGEAHRIDEDYSGRALSSVSMQGGLLNFAVLPIDVHYEGRLSADGASIAGSWHEGGQTYALNLARSTNETEWAIESMKRMAADADPAFEVATIKPSNPENQNSGFHSGDGRRVNCDNETLIDILQFVYGVHSKQILGAPDWAGSDRWDIDGYPDAPGMPDDKQMQAMYRKIMAERFGLKMHTEKKSLSIYAIRMGKGGPKLTKSLDQNGLSDTTFTEFNSQRRVLRVTATNMEEFAATMQFIVDKPLADQTGLPGRYDFVLKWATDETETSDPNAPPGIFTAIQEQLGLKLVPVKAPADVIVIDHMERPSAN
jgi:uncharacterized protein (TIGR03435 family)